MDYTIKCTIEVSVGTYSSSRCAHENVFIGAIGNRVDDRLDSVEGGICLEGGTAESVHLSQGNDFLARTTWRLFGDWNGHLFVILQQER